MVYSAKDEWGPHSPLRELNLATDVAVPTGVGAKHTGKAAAEIVFLECSKGVLDIGGGEPLDTGSRSDEGGLVCVGPCFARIEAPARIEHGRLGGCPGPGARRTSRFATAVAQADPIAGRVPAASMPQCEATTAVAVGAPANTGVDAVVEGVDG